MGEEAGPCICGRRLGQRLEKSRFNLGYNAVDRHIIDGRIDEVALVFADETGALAGP
ncbi:hypothetical protein [Ornithinimicrobium sp. INDO-MA30-4]|uniref:hypothetical protein n=1 Tax=Ornithinimicrobium sp. INDO-MA30-4 TaxID=2908651 RepID=UPI001F21155F|nr:hypothetical protein [Ornithinimicrobium sp. INDO-MA30-4]UJH70820.1 hypothetical protein L0A91_02060 [Ornithinimicrobium sp. INDO-MA30-4]